jgi:hypothetical protein
MHVEDRVEALALLRMRRERRDRRLAEMLDAAGTEQFDRLKERGCLLRRDREAILPQQCREGDERAHGAGKKARHAASPGMKTGRRGRR